MKMHITTGKSLEWHLINEVKGRKVAKMSKLKGNTKGGRLKPWYDHFNRLLGNLPEEVSEEGIGSKLEKVKRIEDGLSF